MMMILIVDGVVMDIIEMMVDKQADLRLHMEDDEVGGERSNGRLMSRSGWRWLWRRLLLH